MTGFTKLWSEILSSSIWNEDDKVRIVWITMLAAMGPDYMVRASVGGLAHMARVSKEACEHALTVLTSPDPDSRSQDNEGRRVQKVDGGFFILNGGKYREARSHDERKVYMANYMKEYRRRQAERKLSRKQRKQNVNACKPPLAQAEAEAEAYSTNPPIVPQGGRPNGQNKDDGAGYTEDFLKFWEAYPKKVGKGGAFSRWKRAVRPETSVLLEALSKQVVSDQWTRDGGQYIPNPETWLSQRRWEDDLFVPVAEKQPAKMSVRDMQTVVMKKEALATEIKEKFASQGPLGLDWKDDGKRNEFRKLRSEIRELNTRIASMA